MKVLTRIVILLGFASIASLTLGAQSPTEWVLVQATLTYHMSHPMHEVDGISRAAKGKGICQHGTCDFLIAAPVKSFDSGDTNRDLHMLETTRGAQFPMVTVRTEIPDSAIGNTSFYADLEVQLAGQTAHFQHVLFQRASQGNEVRITGVVPATCSAFKIDRPTFLAVPIKDEFPVRVDLLWHPI